MTMHRRMKYRFSITSRRGDGSVVSSTFYGDTIADAKQDMRDRYEDGATMEVWRQARNGDYLHGTYIMRDGKINKIKEDK